MTVKYLLNMDAKSDVAMVSDGEYIYAMVNGNLYRPQDGRPVNGNGRQLRDNSRAAIAKMLPAARERLEELTAEDMQPAPAPIPAPAPAPAEPDGNAFLREILELLKAKAADEVAATIYPMLTERWIKEHGALPVTHVIKVPEKPDYKTEDVLHEQFDAILTAVMLHINVYLVGPAGTGKSYLAKQVAKALNLPFYYANCITDDVQLKGFVDANGTYHSTQFRDAFENGGIFLLDELDASIPETAVMLNNALANGYFPFPDKTVYAHEDFRCMATGNTYGTGADDTYNGRYQLDGSTRTRFLYFKVDYDPRIESAMCDNDTDLMEFAHAFRAATKKAGITCLCTYREIKMLHMVSGFMDKPSALWSGLIKGLDTSDVNMICRCFSDYNGGWLDALRELGKEG